MESRTWGGGDTQQLLELLPGPIPNSPLHLKKSFSIKISWKRLEEGFFFFLKAPSK